MKTLALLVLTILSAAPAFSAPSCLEPDVRRGRILQSVLNDRVGAADQIAAIYKEHRGRAGTPLETMSPTMTAYTQEVYVVAADVSRAMLAIDNGDGEAALPVLQRYGVGSDNDMERIQKQILSPIKQDQRGARVSYVAFLKAGYINRLDLLADALPRAELPQRSAIRVYIETLACEAFSPK